MPDSKCGPFNKEEQLFIIEEFARSPTKSVSDVKRAFRQKFENSKPWSRRSCSALHHSAFSRVYDKFKKNGIKDTFNPGQVRGLNKTDENKIKLIQDHFTEFPMN